MILQQSNTFNPHDRAKIVARANAPTIRLIPALAEEIGLNESIVLLQLDFALGMFGHIKDGQRWVYLSLTYLREHGLGWVSRTTLNRAILSLEQRELIQTTTRYNKHAYDKTRWISLNLAAISQLQSVALGTWDETPTVPPAPLSHSEPGVCQNETALSHPEPGVCQNETVPSQPDTRLCQNGTTIPKNHLENHLENPGSESPEIFFPTPPTTPKKKEFSSTPEIESLLKHLPGMRKTPALRTTIQQAIQQYGQAAVEQAVLACPEAYTWTYIANRLQRDQAGPANLTVVPKTTPPAQPSGHDSGATYDDDTASVQAEQAQARQRAALAQQQHDQRLAQLQAGLHPDHTFLWQCTRMQIQSPVRDKWLPATQLIAVEGATWTILVPHDYARSECERLAQRSLPRIFAARGYTGVEFNFVTELPPVAPIYAAVGN